MTDELHPDLIWIPTDRDITILAVKNPFAPETEYVRADLVNPAAIRAEAAEAEAARLRGALARTRSGALGRAGRGDWRARASCQLRRGRVAARPLGGAH